MMISDAERRIVPPDRRASGELAGAKKETARKETPTSSASTPSSTAPIFWNLPHSPHAGMWTYITCPLHRRNLRMNSRFPIAPTGTAGQTSAGIDLAHVGLHECRIHGRHHEGRFRVPQHRLRGSPGPRMLRTVVRRQPALESLRWLALAASGLGNWLSCEQCPQSLVREELVKIRRARFTRARHQV